MTIQYQPRYIKGQRIANRFLVHQALTGGMGEVYLCFDEHDSAPVALKTFQHNNSDLVNIFKEEVANWIALEKHPNIVQCFYMEIFEGIPFMALEWITGEAGKDTSLRSWLRQGPLDLLLTLKFIIDIVQGLEHANQKVPGIVHRDLKPDNVLVNQARQAKITDFGLSIVAEMAKLTIAAYDEPAVEKSQYVGSTVGTPSYMPPEQWWGKGKVDFRTDIYAIGCVLFELLTGQRPYGGRTVNEVREQHFNAPSPALDANFPMGVQQILNTCLAKRREDRYERLSILIDELKTVYESLGGKKLPDTSTEKFTAVDYNNRGVTLSNLGQEERAITDFDQALLLEPYNAQTYSNRGSSYSNLGQEERAITDFDQALLLEPNNALIYYNRGNSYAKLDHHEQAIADYNQSIHLDPTLGEVYGSRGNSYSKLGNFVQAIADYDQVIHLDPNNITAYMNRAICHTELGQLVEAIADYDRAIRVDPNNAQVWFNKGVSLANAGRLQAALFSLEKAVKLGHQSASSASRLVRQMFP
jgi:serine/threonine protein kinase